MVVESSTHNPKIEGSNRATGTGRGETIKKQTLCYWGVCPNCTMAEHSTLIHNIRGLNHTTGTCREQTTEKEVYDSGGCGKIVQ